MKQASYLLQLQTRGKGLYEFTGQVAAWLRQLGVANGLLVSHHFRREGLGLGARR